jgi:hypothetical protein
LGGIAIKGESLVYSSRDCLTLLTMSRAAVERVPEIKAEDVEEVFFGNVLSAK